MPLCTISITFPLLKTCWYGPLFFVTGMIFDFFVLIFIPLFWFSSAERPVRSSILSMHSATRAVSSANSTANTWSGISPRSLLILRFSCLKILSSTILTRSSADADNRLDAFSGQSRSTNMVPFHM